MQQIGSITDYIDVAQLVLYAFWIFFAALILYLRREDKREGYPLDSDRTHGAPRVRVQGFPGIPAPKEFALPHGGSVFAPNDRPDRRPIAAKPNAPWPGAPLVPTGNPLVDAVGPASYAERRDEPDTTFDRQPRIVPLRVATDFVVPTQDPDPRGMRVVAADGERAAIVTDIWVDVSETVIRYYEIQITVAGGTRQALLPANFTRIHAGLREVRVKALYAKHFADIPATRSPDTVTLREEDRIMGYFGGGHLYAHPDRAEPWL
jgi:photosynthetic reaction center H subunit